MTTQASTRATPTPSRQVKCSPRNTIPATSIAGNGTLVVPATKRILTECRDSSLDEEFERQREISLPVRESSDAREGRWRSRRSKRRAGPAAEHQETLVPSRSTGLITGGALSFVFAASPSAAAIWPAR